jgi:hypothetical protein
MVSLYGKIPHLPGSRTGPSDRHADDGLARRLTVAARRGDRVIVQEKLDGSCVAVVRRGGALEAFGREGTPCATARNEGRREFAAWVAANERRFAWLGEGERVVCEWLAIAHGTRYALPHEPVAALDLFGAGGGGRRAVREELAARVGRALPLPHVVHEGGAIGVEAALAILGERGFHGALEPAEGLVWRVEAAGAVAGVAKYVRPGKRDGCYLADHTGSEHVRNAWQDRPA